MTTTISDGTTTVTPALVEGYESTRDSQSIFHPVIGRDYPDVTLRPTSLRKGSLTYLFETEEDSVTCETMHRNGMFTLSASDRSSVAMTYVVDGSVTRTLDDETRDRWHVKVDFQEVAP